MPKQKEPGIPSLLNVHYSRPAPGNSQIEKKIQYKRETAMRLACVFITCQTHISTLLHGSQAYPSVGKDSLSINGTKTTAIPMGRGAIGSMSSQSQISKPGSCAEGMQPTGSSKPSPACPSWPAPEQHCGTCHPEDMAVWSLVVSQVVSDDERIQATPQLVPEAGFPIPG